jgi:hypothetical protein
MKRMLMPTLDEIDTELARRSVQKALCDGLSGHVKPEATVQSPASAARESAMMKDFDHVAASVADAGKVALCGMNAALPVGITLAEQSAMGSPDEWRVRATIAEKIERDLRGDLGDAQAEITRLHSIIGHMASQISALLTAQPSEPDAATGAIPATAATQGRPVTADPAPMPSNALRWSK